MKTALQALIEELTTIRNEERLPILYRSGIKSAIKISKELLELEKQQIIDFHISTMKIGLIEEGETKWSDGYLPILKEVAEKNFNTTYNES